MTTKIIILFKSKVKSPQEKNCFFILQSDVAWFFCWMQIDIDPFNVVNKGEVDFDISRYQFWE